MGWEMRWLKFIYEQYCKDVEMPFEAKLNPNYEANPQVGEVYAFRSLYFVMSDVEYYPYEVFIVSPYWELASHEDLIADGKDRRWVVESLVRYVRDELLSVALKMDDIPAKDVEIMKNYIDKGEPLPEERTGLSYIEGMGSYQEMFREKERERSIALSAVGVASEDRE